MNRAYGGLAQRRGVKKNLSFLRRTCLPPISRRLRIIGTQGERIIPVPFNNPSLLLAVTLTIHSNTKSPLKIFKKKNTHTQKNKRNNLAPVTSCRLRKYQKIARCQEPGSSMPPRLPAAPPSGHRACPPCVKGPPVEPEAGGVGWRRSKSQR